MVTALPMATKCNLCNTHYNKECVEKSCSPTKLDFNEFESIMEAICIKRCSELLNQCKLECHNGV